MCGQGKSHTAEVCQDLLVFVCIVPTMPCSISRAGEGVGLGWILEREKNVVVCSMLFIVLRVPGRGWLSALCFLSCCDVLYCAVLCCDVLLPWIIRTIKEH